jgi:hypothetical protein
MGLIRRVFGIVGWVFVVLLLAIVILELAWGSKIWLSILAGSPAWMDRTTAALLWGGLALVVSAVALQRLAAIVKDGSIAGLRGDAKYRRNLKLVLGLGLLGICLLAGAAISALAD